MAEGSGPGQVRRRVHASWAAALSGLMVVLLVGPAWGATVTVTATVGTWTASGPAETYSVTSDGGLAAASMSYNMNPAGLSTTQSWDFTAAATPALTDGSFSIPYTFTGYHGYFDVDVELDIIVDGHYVEGGTLQTDHADACCSAPSGGFSYSGVATFSLPTDAHTFGFRIIGSNYDTDNVLRGTLTLGTKPYVDPGIGSDNRQWTGAVPISSATAQERTIAQPGESRWFTVPVGASQRVIANLSNLPQDYDLALFGDIQAAFDRLSEGGGSTDLTQLATGSSAGAAVTDTQIPQFPADVVDVPTTKDDVAGPNFAPRVYAPRVYAPRVYAPRVYAPRVYAPRVYAADSFDPDLSGDPKFRDAFTGAQTQSLLAVSAKPGTASEAVAAGSGNTVGTFYVRVQGHDDQSSSPTPFTLSGSAAGGEACAGVAAPLDTSTQAPSRTDAQTVIVTDTSSQTFGFRDHPDQATAFDAALTKLRAATDGAVVDVATNSKVQGLLTQASTHYDCPYAVNLAAQAIKDVVDGYRQNNPAMKYVVLVGNDDVVPFFRYPDLSGLGTESQFDPGLASDNNTSAGSLSNDQVLSQDAYGSDTSVTVSGSTIPIPELGVGRLVETPAEIVSTINHFVEQNNVKTLPTPDTSLVTGYDFLTDAANAVDGEFRGALGANAAGAEHLINDTWNRDDLRGALLDRHHDLVYLAGHFSANDTLAADFTTTLDADVLAANPADDQAARPLEDTLVLSAGCHSAYNTVDDVSSNPPDWAQRMAQQHAVLIGGTGYQYGDTDFLEYSERVYLQVARELRRGTGDPIAVSDALVSAKQDYLASLTQLTGIDEKAMLEATVYGLPMTGVDIADDGRTGDGDSTASRTPTGAGSGPGQVLGLSTLPLPLDTPRTRGHKTQQDDLAVDHELTWFNGRDGVTVEPGVPALPKQVVDVTATNKLLRGVGFRGGTYHEDTGVLPLTGAPAIEGTTPHTSFFSRFFFPQRLTNVNYFDALAKGSGGRTSLIVTPAQYRAESASATSGPVTNTVRNYDHLDLKLFYSATRDAGSLNRPEQAQPPAITGVSGTQSNGKVTFSAHVTGDPSAGVQEVWVAWTGGPDGSGDGAWAPVDLVQDPIDSSLWTGSFTPGPSVQRSKIRFIAQAANGLGSVSLDAADGDGYTVSDADQDTGTVTLQLPTRSTSDALGISAHVEDGDGTDLNGRAVRFRIVQGSTTISDAVGFTNGSGNVSMPLSPGVTVPTGDLQVTADLLPLGTATTPVSTDTRTVTVVPPLSVDLAITEPVTKASPGIKATVLNGTAPDVGRTVRFRINQGGSTAVERSVQTDTNGVASFPAGVTLPVGLVTVVADVMPTTGTTPIVSASKDVTIAGDTLTVAPGALTTRAGTAFASGVTARLLDARGLPLVGVSVTFSLPTPSSSAPASATFPGGGRSVSVLTNSQGYAPSPKPTAGSAVGVFAMTVSAPRATSATVPMASQYGFSKFVSPVVSNGGTTTAGANSTTPVKVSALEANGAKISDAVGNALASAQRVRICWTKSAGTAGGASASTSPVFMKYDASKDFFQSDLKSSTMGWKKGNTYKVTVKIVPSTASPLDLGSTFFYLKIT